MKEDKNRTLTKAELNLMNILWDKGQATVNELVDALPEPKPRLPPMLTSRGWLTSPPPSPTALSAPTACASPSCQANMQRSR